MGNFESCAEQALEAEKLRQLGSAAFLQERRARSSAAETATSAPGFKFAETTAFKTQASAWIDQFCKSRVSTVSINGLAHHTSVRSCSHGTFIENAQNTIEQADQKQEDLSEAAACLLEQLEDEHDKKLSECRFVDYLRQLAGASKGAANAWQPDSLTAEGADWNSWNSLNRNWFAASATEKRYGTHADRADTYALHDRQDSGTNADSLGASILKIEAEISQSPDDASKWWLLGKLNALNEDDYSAMAAYKNAARAINDAKVDYAVSCFNANCMSDAVGAIEDYLQAESAGYRPDASTSISNRIAQIVPPLLELNSAASLNALAILHCINEDTENAIRTIEALILRDRLVTDTLITLGQLRNVRPTRGHSCKREKFRKCTRMLCQGAFPFTVQRIPAALLQLGHFSIQK